MSHKTLNLDLAKTPILKSIVYGRIGDEDMQTVTVNITSRDTPVDLTGFTITFEGITSGGQTKVFDIDGISSTEAGLKAGTFDYTFPNMAFAVAGNYEIAYFSIVKDDKRDTTGEFDIIVEGNADIDAPLAETIITEYNKLVKELHKITDKYISDSDAKFADLNQKIADLQTKITQYQNTVKNTADTAVSTINTTKDSAVSTINSTKDSAVSTVNSTASSAVKTINDALDEFKKGDFYTKAEADEKFATIQSLTDLSNKVVVDKGSLTSVTDLNSLTNKGFYRIGGLVGGTDILNVPSELSGLNFYAFLTVTGSLQELTVYSPKQDTTWTYSRSVSGTSQTWSSWSKTAMADDSGKVTVKNLEVTGTIFSASTTASFTNSPILKDGKAEFYRVGNRVYCSIQADLKPKLGGAYYDLILKEIPTGFKPRRTEVCPALSYNVGTSGDALVRGSVVFNGSKDGGIRMTHPATKDNESGAFIDTNWFTDDPYPT